MTKISDEEFDLFDKMRLDTAIAEMVAKVWRMGEKEGFDRGKQAGMREGRSTLSRSWFLIVLIAFTFGGVAFGAILSGGVCLGSLPIQQEVQP